MPLWSDDVIYASLYAGALEGRSIGGFDFIS